MTTKVPQDIRTDKPFLGQLQMNQTGFIKAQTKPFETILAYLETFCRWVPLKLSARKNIADHLEPDSTLLDLPNVKTKCGLTTF